MMAYLVDGSGNRLIDQFGNYLVTDITPPLPSGGGGDLIVFTTMMSFLLMIFGGYSAPS